MKHLHEPIKDILINCAAKTPDPIESFCTLCSLKIITYDELKILSAAYHKNPEKLVQYAFERLSELV